jgi:hypothetical protein
MVSYVTDTDRGEVRPRYPIRDGMLALDLPLQRCRDCRAPLVFGQAICSFCLSEHIEWALARREGRAAGARQHSVPLTQTVRNVQLVKGSKGSKRSKGSATPDARSNVCPKCSGTLIKDLDGDSECLQCGYIAYARLPKAVPPDGKRRPSHGGLKL